MKLLITGATGLIGSSVIENAQKNNIKVHYLTTRKSMINSIPGAIGFFWNPSIQEIDIQCFDGVDTIIHLAGASISKKWTPKNKKEIFQSRVLSTQLLRNLKLSPLEYILMTGQRKKSLPQKKRIYKDHSMNLDLVSEVLGYDFFPMCQNLTQMLRLSP